MTKIRHIIPLCDETLDTVRVTSYLFEKYWPGHEIDFIGFAHPSYALPENHKFISIAPKQEGGSKKWTRYIAEYVNSMTEEFLIFSLDDFFPCCSLDEQMFAVIVEKMKNNSNIGRFCLSYDAFNYCSHELVEMRDGYNIISIDKSALYRISTQPALWRKDYLLKFLEHDWSPWNFEINGSQLSSTFKEEVYGTADPAFKKVPSRWVNKGSVSRQCPGRVNVLGLSIDAIIDLLRQGFYTESQLQWGMWGGQQPIPQFYDLGGFSFHPKYMPPHEASPSNWREFYRIYEQPDPAYQGIERPMIINLFDRHFIHTLELPDYGFISSNGEPVSRTKKLIYLPYHKTFQNHSGITVFTDHMINKDLVRSIDSKIKIAWLMEPPQIHGFAYQNLMQCIEDFDYVLTFDQSLIDKYDKCHFMPMLHVRVKEDMWGLHEKTKKVSMIASKKQITEGHILRHKVASELAEKHNIDLWGSGYKQFPVGGAVDALKDYMFSIVIDNVNMDNYISHITNSMILGTVPIYWGTKRVGEHFNEKGVICFENIEELDSILMNLSDDDYYSRLEYIKENFEIVKQNFWNTDEQLYNKIKEIVK